uniref:Uncharacterized protein n=1 Tax=viral metagenome TaxID=1070528 RepID=A0A6C0BMR0_9ZZZZ
MIRSIDLDWLGDPGCTSLRANTYTFIDLADVSHRN